MFRKMVLTSIFVVGVLGLGGCQPAGESTPVGDVNTVETLPPGQVLVLGDVSGNPAWTIEHFQPLADYLAAQLADFGIRQGRVVVTSDLETMMDYLENGQVDLYFDSPYPALEVYKEIGAHPLARRWKSGVAEYYSMIVVVQDSGITDLDGLLGQMLACDHPASTSGYLLPKSYMVANGYRISEKDGVDAAVAADEVGYVFAYGEDNQLAWLLRGQVAGAAFSNGDYDRFEDGQRDRLVVLAQTPSVPRNIALARPGMDAALQSRITELLLGLSQSPGGGEILETFEHTSRFDALPNGPEGTMEALEELFAPVQ